MNKSYEFILLACLLFIASCHQHTEMTKSPFQHFYDENDLVKLVAETDMTSLLADQEDYDYQPVQLTLQKENSPDEHFQIETKPRGVFRKANCTFPPLKIRFPDELLAAHGFMDYPTLKLVTHCEEDPAFQQLILKEYLIFKLYNELTDNSFRVQLVKVTYCDSRKKHENIERFGFLIEHPKELANRMNGSALGEAYGAPKSIHLPAYKIFTIFQYMVGNTDWGLGNRHNVILIQPKEGDLKLPIPVPYDFDFCGLVDAPYAVPHYNIPIANVKERFFQWRGGEVDFTDVFDLFKNKKDNLLGIVADCPYLDDTVRAEAMDYLNSFFEQLERPEAILGEKVLGAADN